MSTLKSSPSTQEKSTRPSNTFDKENFMTESLVGPLDYISSDPGKQVEDNAELRRIYEQIPMSLDLRRSVSHNPQIELDRGTSTLDNGRYFEAPEIFDRPLPRMMSPNYAEDILMNEHFNEGQMKTIMNVIEQKVGERIEEKIRNFSNEILARFQDEVRNLGLGRGANGFGMKGMSMSGSRMFMRRGKETQEDNQSKECNNCGEKIIGIKYSCLTCRNFICCEQCEGTIDHPHPLLKIRPSKEGAKQESGTANEGPAPLPIDQDNYGRLSSSKNPSNIFLRTNPSVNTDASRNIDFDNQRDGQMGTKRTSEYNNIGNVNGMNSYGFSNMSKSSIPSYMNKQGRGIERGSLHSYGTGSTESNQNNKVLFKSSTSMMLSPTIMPSQSMQTIPKPLGEREFKQYKVALVKPPLYEVTTVKAGHPYHISFTIKNNGDLTWPEDTKLICIEGVHKGDEINLPALEKGASYTVDLHLQAPWELGRFFNEWKVHYVKDGNLKSFGKEISIEIEVVESEKIDKGKREKVEKVEKVEKIEKAERETRDNLHGDKGVVGEEDKRLLKELDCSEQILKHAKVLQDLMCAGTLKEKVEFMKSCGKNWDLNQIVSAYLTWLNTHNKTKVMNGNNPTPQ